MIKYQPIPNKKIILGFTGDVRDLLNLEDIVFSIEDIVASGVLDHHQLQDFYKLHEIAVETVNKYYEENSGF